MNPGAWWALGIGWPFAVGAVAVLAGKLLKRASGDMEAIVDATRETELWADPCGCRWEMPRDAVWVPCDRHADRLLRAVQDGEAL